MEEARNWTAEEMERRQVARFHQLKPTKHDYARAVGVPVEAYEQVASKNIYLLLAPTERKRAFSPPAVFGTPGLEISIVDCPPGNGPKLHTHEKTRETFMPLTGNYEIVWGDQGEHSTVLEPLDMFAVPPGVYRTFRNVSSHDAKMLVIVQGEKHEVMNDVVYPKDIGGHITSQFGPEVWAKFLDIGLRVAD